MFDSAGLIRELSSFLTSKLYFGLSNTYIDGYHTVSLPNIDDYFYKVKLPYSDNSIEEVIIKDYITHLRFDKLERFFSELSRVMKENAEISIQFLDYSYLFQQINNNVISLEKANTILFNASLVTNSIVDKEKIVELLNKHNFQITDTKYIDYDYENNCLIDAKLIRSSDNSIQNQNEFDEKRDIFDGINFDFPNEVAKEESDFDTDLFDEVLSTNKHADTLDLALLSEVIDFDIDDNMVAEVKDDEEIQELQVNESDNLLEEIMNFNFGNEGIVSDSDNREQETYGQLDTQVSQHNSLLSEVMNFTDDFDEKQDYSEFTPDNRELVQSEDILASSPAINIVWEGSQYSYNPTALSNREICNKLAESQVAELTIVPAERETTNFNLDDAYINVLNNDIRRKKEVSEEVSKLPYAWVRSQTSIKKEAPKGAKWIIRYDCQYSAVPKEDFDALRSCSEIWTSTFHSRKALIDAGIDFNKVQVIHKGVNPSIFTPYGNKYSLNSFKKLKFLFVGETTEREGFDIILNAFTNLFNSSDNVCLVIKDSNKGNYNTREFINSKTNNYDSPEVIYIDDDLTEREIASLYRACDILVSPYRAASSALSILEAMACGLPVIASKGGPSEDYLEEAFSRYIDTEIINHTNFYDGKEYITSAITYEPSEKSLSDILLYYYNNPSGIKSMGALGSAFTRSKWTWADTTIKILRRLDYIYSTKMATSAEKKLTIDSDIYIYLGVAENEYILQKYSEATDYYMSVISGLVDDRYKLLSMHRIATILISKNELDAAQEILNIGKTLYIDHPDSQYLKVILETVLGNYYDAIDLLNKLVENWQNLKYDSDLGHHLDDLIVLNGDLLLAINDYEAAESLYKLAISMNSHNEFAYFGLAKCLRHKGRIDEARANLQSSIEINPNFDEAKVLLEEISN